MGYKDIEKQKAYNRAYLEKNRERIMSNLRRVREEDREAYNRRHREYMAERKKDPEYRAKYNAYFREYERKRRLTDPEWAERHRAYGRANYAKNKKPLTEI